MNATARWTPERCEVWTPTQNGEAALAAASEAAGLPLAKCDVYKLLLGGGFGRRGAVHDWVRQAVAIAKEMPGTPVKLIWSREEDMLHGRYHPVTQCKLTAGLDAARQRDRAAHAHLGPVDRRRRLPAEHQGRQGSGGVPGPESAGTGSVDRLHVSRAADRPCDAQSAVPPGFWRGVNLNQNTIYLECFIDELAHATGAGSARVPAQADGQPSEASGGAQRGGRTRRLGHAGAEGRLPRPGADDGLRQLRRRLRGGLGER